jgi:dTDP-4-dehydrorhamnose reductase
MTSLEMWGGVECTLNRVGDRYFDQMAWSGHEVRLTDLELIAALGIRALRQPVLWERVSPDQPDVADWAWSDERLGRLRQLQIRPIVGLLHHGSGPRYTNLLDPSFAELLSNHAARVAERYPWVDAYTPVNEPLTTARFSGLYGHWYPHRQDDRAFVRCLLNQLRGVVLSMRAVRQVRADAELIQTEDLGKTHSTPALRVQARFENQRRWLTFDLLDGRVDRNHPLYRYLSKASSEAEVLWFRDNPCPPTIFGANYYVTSERFLDDRIDRYPPHLIGSNGRQTYVDVEAVRTGRMDGAESLLRSLCRRYHRPIAVTEAHIGCTIDEQVRWLVEIWRAAQQMRSDGLDVRAVTTWAMFGAFDWDSLVTLRRGHYESGVFDLATGHPRPTELAEVVRDLAIGSEPKHPALSEAGWWHRPERILFAHDTSTEGAAVCVS